MIRVALYQLKKQYGNGPIYVHQYSGAPTVDFETGDRVHTTTVTTIKTAVILPAKAERHVVNSISKISADKGFVYGGTYDRTRRMILIDQRDAPDLNLKKDDWIVYRGRRYDVATFDSFEFDSLWVVIAHELAGELPPNVVPVSVTDAFNVAGGTTWST